MNTSAADPLNAIAEEFQNRHRAGERPTIEEFAERYPEYADQIRSLFPVLISLEDAASAVAGPDPGPQIMPGSTLGEFHVVREIGRGGMGTVYEAIQEPLGRTVALKVLSRSDASTSLIERFRREARTASRLHHTNIVPVFGGGVAAGRLYFAMQLIRGQNLAEILHEVRAARQQASTQSVQGTVTPRLSDHSTLTAASGSGYFRAITTIGIGIAEAIAHAHTQGVLHRDVKPSNVILDDTGRPWVSDFGLAKAEDDPEDLTASNDLIGTLRYLSPERLRGKCGPPADLFGLGAILYELLAMRPAFDQANRPELIQAIERCEPIPLKRIDSSIPADLATVIETAMAREPQARYASASDLADDLRQVLAGQPIRARRSGLLGRSIRWARRNPIVAGLSFALVSMILVSAIAITFQNRALRIALNDRNEALSNELTTNSEVNRLLRQSYIDQAALARGTGQSGQRTKSLDLLARAAAIHGGNDLHGPRIESLSRVDWQAITLTDAKRQTLFGSSLHHGVTPSLRITFRSTNQTLTSARFRTAIAWLLMLPSWLGGALQAPKHSSIPRMRHGPHDVTFMGPYRGQTQTLADLTPDYLALFGVCVENAYLLQPPLLDRVIWPMPADVRSVELSRDQVWAAVVCGPTSQRIEIRSCTTGQLRQTLTVDGPVAALAWSPTNRWLAVATLTGRLSTWHTHDWSVAANAILVNQPIKPDAVRSVQFSADDRYLLIVSTAGVLTLHSPESAVPLVSHSAFEGSLHARFSQSGRPIVGGPGTARALEIIGGDAFRLLCDDTIRESTISSDGRWLATRSGRSRPGIFDIWDLPTGQRTLTWTMPKTSRLVGMRANTILEYRVAAYELWAHEFVRGADQVWRWLNPTLITAFHGQKNAKNAEPTTIHFASSPDEFVIHADEFMHLFVKQPNEGRTDRMFSWTAAMPDAFIPWTIPSSPRIVFDPSGRWIIADANYRTVVLDRTTKEVRQQLPIIPNASWVSNDNGEFVMQIGKQQAVLWRTTDWTVVETWKSQSSTNQMQTAFLPGHDQFFLSRDGMIECRSYKTGELKYQWSSPRPIVDLQITPNGRYLIGSGSGLQVWDLTLFLE